MKIAINKMSTPARRGRPVVGIITSERGGRGGRGGRGTGMERGRGRGRGGYSQTVPENPQPVSFYKPPAKYITGQMTFPETIPIEIGKWYEDEIWKDEVMRFSKSLITDYVLNLDQDEPIRTQFFNFLDENSIHAFDFYKAFISETEDPIYNYETLEKIGDSAIRAAMNRYIYIKNSLEDLELGPEGITDYINKYSSKKEFADISKNVLKISSANIRYIGTESPTLYEDVFEAFTGAMFSTGEIFRSGFGYFMCQRFTETLMGPGFFDIKFTPDETYKAKPAQNILKELYELIPDVPQAEKSKSGLYDIFNEDRTKYAVKFELSPSLRNYIEKIFPGSVIDPKRAVVYKSDFVPHTKDNIQILRGIAARKGADYLKASGFDEELIMKIRFTKQLMKMKRYGLDIEKLKRKLDDRNIIALVKKEDDKFGLIEIREVTRLHGKAKLFKETTIASRKFVPGDDKNAIEMAMYEEYIGK